MTSLVLIGCGAVAKQFYLPALRALAPLGELRVHALVDPSAAARAPLAAAFPAAHQHDDLAEVNAPPGALAVIATPPRFHLAQTLAAFDRGWHVLCEKPMAATAAECDRMLAAARAADRHLAVGLYKRFFPASLYLKNLCQHHQLGPLLHYDIAEGGPFRWPAATPSFFIKEQTPGGVLLDIGVHVLDLLLWWLGEPASLTYADDAMGGLETNARLALRHAGGATGALHFSRDWPTAQRYLFDFERGRIVWRVNRANTLELRLHGTPATLAATLQDPLTAAPQSTQPQAFIAQLRNLAAAIDGRAPLHVPGDEGARSLRLIETCYRQKKLLAQPWLSAAEQARAQTILDAPGLPPPPPPRATGAADAKPHVSR
ncbi:Gfo/Idh/MocA family oxidoreductase [Termitidicoccus mucosus]|uniref:Oxidoreductase n=1 Tax=Termitidicoccus mucosus TaxID=1184151 RepID=A0A178IDD1_9BACT|nr:hypothetical protein AW736_22165 [Opitutaceae bacterium TSB47]